jgi:hypothetical protein
MSVGDGFNLWLGKLLVVVAVIGCVVVFATAAVIASIAYDKYRAWRNR